jgi:serine/threonine-protein kinase HipA
VKKLYVIYCGWGEQWTLGTLADNGTDLLFEYSSEALRQGLQLSPRHLPLRAQAYGGFPAHLSRLPGLIADALPDGWGLMLMDRLFRSRGREASTLSVLDRLAFIADRALGALRYEPADTLELVTEDVELLRLAQASQAVVAGKDGEALRSLALMGGSPQGARPKVLVYIDESTNTVSTLPHAGAKPWLVKFQAGNEHREVCAIENLYADLARDCGLDMPSTRYFDLDKKLAAFGTERFDIEDGMRVPTHTLAGALHADFRVPSAVDYTTFLRATRLFTRDEREVQKAFERAVFNVVFNNRDDHCKNVSFRMDRARHWKISPAYDLTFSTGPGGEHQMDVCGEGRNVTRAKLLELCRTGGLNEAWGATVIDRTTQTAGAFKQTAAGRGIRTATVQSMVSAIEANRNRMV